MQMSIGALVLNLCQLSLHEIVKQDEQYFHILHKVSPDVKVRKYGFDKKHYEPFLSFICIPPDSMAKGI